MDNAVLERDISDLLKTERAMLTDGRFDALASISERKMALLSPSALAGLRAEQISAIGRDVLRNQRLLSEARRGIEDAAERVREMRTAKAGFRSYGPEGQSELFSTITPSVERKA